MNQPQRKGSFSGAGLGVTAVLAMVICCAAPVLLAGGVLASLGAAAANPLVIALGVAVVGGAVVFAVVHRHRRVCCLPLGAHVSASSDDGDEADRARLR